MNFYSSKSDIKISDNVSYCIFDKKTKQYLTDSNSNIIFNTNTIMEFKSLKDASCIFHMAQSQFPDYDLEIQETKQIKKIISHITDNDKIKKIFLFLNEHCLLSSGNKLKIVSILSSYSNQKFLVVFSAKQRTKDIKKWSKKQFNENVFTLTNNLKCFYADDISTIVLFKLLCEEILSFEIINLDTLELVGI